MCGFALHELRNTSCYTVLYVYYDLLKLIVFAERFVLNYVGYLFSRSNLVCALFGIR